MASTSARKKLPCYPPLDWEHSSLVICYCSGCEAPLALGPNSWNNTFDGDMSMKGSIAIFPDDLDYDAKVSSKISCRRCERIVGNRLFSNRVTVPKKSQYAFNLQIISLYLCASLGNLTNICLAFSGIPPLSP